MADTWRRPYGLRPTLRHLMILVVHVAIVAAVAVPALRSAPTAGSFWLVLVLLASLSTPLLAGLILVLDRPGPATYWLAGLVASLFPPAVVIAVDAMTVLAPPPVGASLTGMGVLGPGVIGWGPLAILNAFGLVLLLRSTRRLPSRCADCGRWSALPLGRLSSGIRWCASCGHKRPASPR